MTIDHVIADTKKGYTMTAYTNDLAALKSFVTQRYAFLTNHAELRPSAPKILALRGPTNAPTAAEGAVVVADVRGADGVGVDSVWLYHRAKSYGRFDAVPMYDDGAHGDGAAGDGTYGGTTTNYPAGSKVRYYVEARSANTAKAAAFFPPRAEQEVQSYRVAVTTAPDSPVVIEEFLAANVASHADPQGDFDDWIELHNVTDAEVDLTGRYLSDEPNNPRKWAFPDGTRIPAGGYLIVWADEDGSADAGLHASFKLDKAGEQILLTDTDARLNAILDSVTFGPQEDDRSYGRTAADADVWAVLTPTPGAPNP
ncbi:MAG: lamin tail domain-containing protein [Verrucomicrobiales bacterium]|nr:lamin tail domain-containing protein [Verrucomicrobiales bacterium]